MAGLLDFIKSPEGVGLLSAVAGGMAGARRGTPWNNVGRAGLAGLTGYSQAQDQIRQNEEKDHLRQYRQMQMEQMRQTMEKQKAETDWRAQLPQKIRPQLTGSTDQGRMLADQNAEFGQEGLAPLVEASQYAQPDAPLNMNYGVDKAALQEHLLAPGSPMADKLLEAQFTKTPKWNVVERFNEQTGMPEKVLMNESDPTQVVPFGGTKSDVPEGMRLVNGQLQAIPGYLDMKTQIARAGAPQVNYGQPQIFTRPDGTPVAVQFGNKPGSAPQMTPLTGLTPTDKPPTGEENSAAGYLGRMQAAEKLISGLGGGEPTVGTTLAGSVPLIGDYVQRNVMSDTQQKYKQAADDWIRAKLRKESGAVIGDEEMLREYQTYFPQPGDKPGVRAQKAQSRRQAEQQMIQSAGRAVKQRPATLDRGEILNEELRAAVSSGDQQNAQLIREEMRRMGVKEAGVPKPAAKTQSFDLPPNAKQYAGKVITDTKTGRRFKSDGTKWVPQ